MPNYTLIGTTRAVTKVYNLWDPDDPEAVSGNVPPPDGWEQPAFDDSGWSTSATPADGGNDWIDGHRYPNGLPDFAYSASQQKVAYATNPIGVAAGWLNRWTFTSPILGWVLYTIERAFGGKSFAGASLSDLGSFYLNGWEFTMLSTGGQYEEPIGAIAAHLSAPGVSNLLAWRTQTTWWQEPAETSGFAWDTVRLAFYIPEEQGGTPLAWGTVETGVNDLGVLGTGDLVSHLTPTQMVLSAFDDPENPRVVKITSNGKTTLLLDTYGSVYGCGDNNDGLALASGGDASAHAAPVRLTGLEGALADQVADVSVGGDALLLLGRLGQVYGIDGGTAFGNQKAAYVGAGFDLAKWLAISAGKTHYLLLDMNEDVFASGANDMGQLGLGHTTSPSFGTMLFDTGPAGDITSIAAGDEVSLVLAGGTYGCGRAEFGALGVELYDIGSGSNKVVSELTSIVSFTTVRPEQFGPISAGFAFSGSFDTGVIHTLGDGVPYGGAGDGDGTIVYGTDPLTEFYQVASPTFTDSARAGGVVNGFDGSGDSLAVCGGIAPDYPAAGVVENILTITGGSLDTGTATYLWPSDNDVHEIGLPTVRAARLIVQNVAGGGTNVTVTAGLDWYSAGDLGDFISGAGGTVSVPVGQTRTLFFRSPELGTYGLQAYLTHSSGTKTNVINATLELILEDETSYLLYTWGYGGWGQMGSGSDSATNLSPVSINGMTAVEYAVFAERTGFAIARGGATVISTQGTWVQIVG